MSGDLDLALRIRADLDQARAELRRLRAETGQAGTTARTAGRGYEQAASGIARSTTAARGAATAQERLTRATRAGAAATAGQATAAQHAARAARELSAVRERVSAADTKAARAALKLAVYRDRAAREALRVARAETSAVMATQRAARTALQAATAQERLTRATRAGAAAGLAHRQAMGASRASLINVGYQVQDVAVQMASGTAASRALSQQLPQLLSGFGLLGVVLGTASAVLIPLAGHLFGAGEAAEEAGNATDRLADSTDRLRGLQDLRGDLDAIREKYGEVTAGVYALIAAEREIERRASARAARQAVEDILSGDLAAKTLDRTAYSARAAGEKAALEFAEAFRQHVAHAGDAEAFGRKYNAAIQPWSRVNPRDVLYQFGFADIADEAKAAGVSVEALALAVFDLQTNSDFVGDKIAERLNLAEAGFEKLAAKTGLSVDAVREVGAALEALRDADGIKAQQEAATRLRHALRAAANAAPDLTDDQQAQNDQLLGDVVDLEGHLRELLATDGRNPGLDTMSEQARTLAEEFERALAALDGLAAGASHGLAIARIRAATVGQPVQRARAEALHDAEGNIAAAEASLRGQGVDSGIIQQILRDRRLAAQTTADEAAEEARLNQQTAAAEAALRKARRGGGGRGADPTATLERRLEGYVRTAERARVSLQGLGEVEEARAIAAAEAAHLAEAAIAKVGDAPGAAAQVAGIRALETALIAAATEAAELNRELRLGPQGAAAMAGALRDYAEDAIHAGDEIAEATTRALKGMEDALVGFVTTGKIEFSGLVDAILADLARIVIRQGITGPLADALSEVLGGIFGGGAAPATSPRPTARPWHVGGVVTDTPALYHSGGVAGATALTRAREIVTASSRHGPSSREVPALLTAGEAVLTAPQAAAIEAALASLDRPRFHAGGVAIDPATIPKIYEPAAPTVGVSAAATGQDIADRLAASLTPLMERLASAADGPRQLRVHIDNQGSGPPLRPREAAIEPDIEGAVVRIITEDDATGGPISQTMSRAIGKRRGDFW